MLNMNLMHNMLYIRYQREIWKFSYNDFLVKNKKRETSYKFLFSVKVGQHMCDIFIV